METRERITAPYILSLVAGILILVGGIASLAMSIFWRYIFSATRFGDWYGMMGPGMMGGWSWMGFWKLGVAISIVGIVIGIIVLYSAVMLRAHPENHATWGTLILVFSILSFIGAWAGFGIGLVLGVIGGALAISWKPAEAAITPPTAAKFCVHCGKPISKEARYCPYCGQQQPT